MAELDEISRVQNHFSPHFLLISWYISRVHLPYSANWRVNQNGLRTY